jgi:hypothetical protein
MRSEQEIKEFLEKCEKARGFGMSQGPCPLKVNEVKSCLEYCTWNDEKLIKSVTNDIVGEEKKKAYIANEKKMCCEDWDKRAGCCAECSFPSALEWVLGKNDGATDNGQKRLINALKEIEKTGETFTSI